MTIDMYKKVIESIGYENMVKGLDLVFKNNYKIIKIIPSDDVTSSDFSSIIDVENITGIDIEVGGSGNSHQFQTGNGTMDIAVPEDDGFGILPSGKHGELLSDIINDNSIEFGASADNFGQIEQYLQKLKFLSEQK